MIAGTFLRGITSALITIGKISDAMTAEMISGTISAAKRKSQLSS
jgi:hypothetical protein